MSLQAVRDSLLYNYGYLQGRAPLLTTNIWSIYGNLVSKFTSMLSLPLPLLSFAALPFFGSTSTTINLAFFWLVWTTFVWRHGPLEIEIYGTLVINLLFFLLPSYAFLAFDALVPNLSAGIKASGVKQLPSSNANPRRLANIAAVATFNIFLGIAAQAIVELILTEVLHTRSGLRVSTLLPHPWSIIKDIIRAIVLRGFIHYAIHRHLLHSSSLSSRKSQIARWHLNWAHSVRYPFSLTAAYDHPICYLLTRWLPLYLPAVMFRYHILTWHILVALASLEQLFIYSGYAVLPSSILLSGMARRTDAHYATKGQGNFGHWGLLDWAFGTSCPGNDVVDDLHAEADKRNIQDRMADVKHSAKGLVSDVNGEVAEDVDEPESPTQSGRRRSKRKTRKPLAIS